MKRLLMYAFPGLCLAVVLVWWTVLQTDGYAETTAQAAPGAQGEGSAGLGNLALRVSLALALILLLIVGAVYLLRLLGGRSGADVGGKVKVLDRCHLAPKRALYTVRMGGRVVVVGVTESSITPVLELSDEESRQLYPEGPVTSTQEGNFSSFLRGAAARVPRLRT